MSDLQRTVLDFYQITTPFPETWPAEKDNVSEGSDSEENEGGGEKENEKQRKARLNRRKSRYQALERAATNRSSHIPGSEKGGNLVARDEPDPLGTTDSVMVALKRNGVRQIQEDAKLRNRFLLSSTTFSPGLFLSQVHTDASTESLLAGLEALSRSIDQKSASLKVLVETNFERFVRAKATIDNVYKEMKYRGGDPAAEGAGTAATPSSLSRARAHSRHASRNSFRSSMGGAAALGSPYDTGGGSSGRKRNALVKESEYGVMGIKVPLLEVSAKAEDVWGPALGGREKEETLRVVSSALERYQECVEASAAVADSIKRGDHESLVEEYHKARQFAEAAREIVVRLGSDDKKGPTDEQLQRIVLAGRMWHDVEEQIAAYKRDVWRKLTATHGVAARADAGGPGGPAGGAGRDQHMELIGLLLELGVEDNPIWVWLLSRYDYLKGKIQGTCDRSKVEIELLRRRVASSATGGSDGAAMAAHVRALGRPAMESKMGTLDAPDVVELWDKVHGFLVGLLSGQGILGEVAEFWQTAEGFLSGQTQKGLPTGYRGASQGHHRLTGQQAQDLEKGAGELVELVREAVFGFFAGPPPEDLSLLFSPVPPSPKTPLTAGGSGGPLSPTGVLRDPRFQLDPKSPPPPSPPRRGEAWEKFAFWPPHANSISGAHYLAKLLGLVGTGAAAMAGIGRAEASEVEALRTLVGTVRERCVTALCAAWNRDAENVKYVEDWHRAADRRDVTRMPAAFAAFEGAILAGMQTILYVPEAMSKPGAGSIVVAPPAKLLQTVRGQYVTTLYKALSGMVENAERPVKKADDEWTAEGGAVAVMTTAAAAVMTATTATTTTDNRAFHAGDRNVRMLLTLSNLQSLRAEVVPRLNAQFENAFAVKLTDETKTIRDVLGQIDTRLFLSYTRPSVEALRQIVRGGVLKTDEATAVSAVPSVLQPGGGAGGAGKPRTARPYVYEALLLMVLVHSQVSTTAVSLTGQVLSHLLEQLSRELLEALKQQPAATRYDLAALMQATLDVEFVAQTLSQYTTERASELQGQIYQELDARTDNDARARLQSELPEMRSVLKRLREASKNEFACFRKPKRGTTGGGSGGGGSGSGSGSSSTNDRGGSFGGGRTASPGPM